MEFIRTENQLADILMKPLRKEKFGELSSKIGLLKTSVQGNKVYGENVRIILVAFPFRVCLHFNSV
jgi:hypothetical protein